MDAANYSRQYVVPPAHNNSGGAGKRVNLHEAFPHPHRYYNAHQSQDTPYFSTNMASLHVGASFNCYANEKVGSSSVDRRNGYSQNFNDLPSYNELNYQRVTQNREWPALNHCFPHPPVHEQLANSSFPPDSGHASALRNAQIDYLACLERNPPAAFVTQYQAHISSLQAQLYNFVSCNLPASCDDGTMSSFQPSKDIFSHAGNALPFANAPSFVNGTRMSSSKTRTDFDMYSPRNEITHPGINPYALGVPNLHSSSRDHLAFNDAHSSSKSSANVEMEYFPSTASRQRFSPYPSSEALTARSDVSRRRKRRSRNERLLSPQLSNDSTQPPLSLLNSRVTTMNSSHTSKPLPPLKLHIIAPSGINEDEDLAETQTIELDVTNGRNGNILPSRPPPLFVGNRMLAKKLREKGFIDLTDDSHNDSVTVSTSFSVPSTSFSVPCTSFSISSTPIGDTDTVYRPSLSVAQDCSSRSVLDLSVDVIKSTDRPAVITSATFDTSKRKSFIPPLIRDVCLLNNYEDVEEIVPTSVHARRSLNTNYSSMFDNDRFCNNVASVSGSQAPNPEDQLSGTYCRSKQKRASTNKSRSRIQKSATVSRPPDLMNYRQGSSGFGTGRHIMNYDSEMCDNSGSKAASLNSVPPGLSSSVSTLENMVNDIVRMNPSYEVPNPQHIENMETTIGHLRIKQEVINENEQQTDSTINLSAQMIANVYPVSNEPLEVNIDKEVSDNDNECNDEQIESDIIRIQDQNGNNIVCSLSTDFDSYSNYDGFRAPFTSPGGSEGSGSGHRKAPSDTFSPTNRFRASGDSEGSSGRRRKKSDKSWDGSLSDVSRENDSLSDFGEIGNDGVAFQFRCELCNYCGRSQSCLNKHYKAHTQADRICYICQKAFERGSDLSRHVELHLKRNEHNLEDCMSTPKGRHLLTSPRFSKKKLGSSLGKAGDRTRHTSKEDAHRRSQLDVLQCSRCTCTFHSAAELDAHSLSYHIGAARIDTYDYGAFQDTAIVSCELTDKNEVSIDFIVSDLLLSKSIEIPGISKLDRICNFLESSVSEQIKASEPLAGDKDTAIVSMAEECDTNSMPQLEPEIIITEDCLLTSMIASPSKQCPPTLEYSDLSDETNSVNRFAQQFNELRRGSVIKTGVNDTNFISKNSMSVAKNRVTNINEISVPKAAEKTTKNKINRSVQRTSEKGAENGVGISENCVPKASEQTELPLSCVKRSGGVAIEELKKLIMRNCASTDRRNVESEFLPSTRNIDPNKMTSVESVIRESTEVVRDIVDHPLDLSACKIIKNSVDRLENNQDCSESAASVPVTDSSTLSACEVQNKGRSLLATSVELLAESKAEVESNAELVSNVELASNTLVESVGASGALPIVCGESIHNAPIVPIDTSINYIPSTDPCFSIISSSSSAFDVNQSIFACSSSAVNVYHSITSCSSGDINVNHSIKANSSSDINVSRSMFSSTRSDINVNRSVTSGSNCDVNVNQVTDATSTEHSISAVIHSPAIKSALSNQIPEEVTARKLSSNESHSDVINSESWLLSEILDVKPSLKVTSDVDATAHVFDDKAISKKDEKNLLYQNVKTDVCEEDYQPSLDANGRGVYVCVGCKYTTFMRYKYVQHMKAHNGRFICKACGKACIKSSDLYRHWTTHNIKGTDGHYACDSCSFTSPVKDAVEQHMRQHYILRPDLRPTQAAGAMSRCGICFKSVPRLHIFEHKRAMHGRWLSMGHKPRVSTSVDGDISSTKIIVKKCESRQSKCTNKKSFACPKCELGFQSPHYLLRHYFVHHQGGDWDDLQPWGVKMENGAAVCRCRFCGVQCGTVEDLHKHEINHILETSTNNNNNNGTDFNDCADNISKCGDFMNVATATTTTTNLSTISVKDMSSLFRVEVKPSCSNNYLQSNPSPKSQTINDTKVIISPRKKHRRRRRSYRRITCPHCPRVFKLNYHYEQHLRTHTILHEISTRNEQFPPTVNSSGNNLNEQRCSFLPPNIADSSFSCSVDAGGNAAINNSDDQQQPTDNYDDSSTLCQFVISDVVGSVGTTGPVDAGDYTFQNSINPVIIVEPFVIEPQDDLSELGFSFEGHDSSARSAEFNISAIRSLKEEMLQC